jgi:hypothetical protein
MPCEIGCYLPKLIGSGLGYQRTMISDVFTAG